MLLCLKILIFGTSLLIPLPKTLLKTKSLFKSLKILRENGYEITKYMEKVCHNFSNKETRTNQYFQRYCHCKIMFDSAQPIFSCDQLLLALIRLFLTGKQLGF